MAPDLGTLFGMHVVLNNYSTPKMQLSEGCPVTPAFREEINKWMVDFFGSTPLIPDGEVLVVGNHTVYMNGNTFHSIKYAQQNSGTLLLS